MQNFRDLKVWQNAHRLTLDIYVATKGFPDDERFGLVSQLRRASVSIGANLAEGCCRSGDREFARFAAIALGSASEVENLLLVSRDLQYLSGERHQQLERQIQEVKQMLSGLLRRLRGEQPSG